MQIIVTILASFFAVFQFFALCQSAQQQRKSISGGSFVQLFDQNRDAKVEIGKELKEYYENATKQLNAILNSQNCTRMANETESEHRHRFVDGIINAEDFHELNLIDPKLLSTMNASAEADVNGDGRLSVEEQTQFTMNVVAKYHLDMNQDGFVDAYESLEYDQKMAIIQFKEFDKNQNGKLNLEELKEFLAPWRCPLNSVLDNALAHKYFDLSLEKVFGFLSIKYGFTSAQISAADLDKNGNLTYKELFDSIGIQVEIAKQNLAEPLNESIDTEMIEKADRNGDGALDRGEYIDLFTVDLAIKVTDANKDGMLSEREFLDAFIWFQGYYLGLNRNRQKDKITKMCT